MRTSNLPNVNAATRWLPATGILAALALALTGLISPPPPVAGAPASDIAIYYGSHHTGLELESVVDGVGATLLVIFAAVFHTRIRSMPSLTALAGAAILAACIFVEVAAFQALAFRPNPDPIRAALPNDLQSFTFQVGTFPTLLFLGAAAAAIFTSSSLPRWVGLAAAVATALQAVAWISFFAPSGILAAGAYPDILAFAALLGWLVASSIAMSARRVPPRETLG